MAKQQTGFRAEEEELNRFRSRIALLGRSIGESIEAFIIAFNAGRIPEQILDFKDANSLAHVDGAQQEHEGSEWETVSKVAVLLRAGGEIARTLRQQVRMLDQMRALMEAQNGESGKGVGIEDRLNESEKLAREIERDQHKDN